MSKTKNSVVADLLFAAYVFHEPSHILIPIQCFEVGRNSLSYNPLGAFYRCGIKTESIYQVLIKS